MIDKYKKGRIVNAPLRIGMLGCAATAESAMFNAIAQGAPITVAAVAARDPARAQDYALQRNIPAVFASYEALLAEADIDAIYVPLPNALHHRWVLAALAAGHHVLCEKPIAIDAARATEMVCAAEERGLLLVEAFHWRAHPLAQRIAQLARRLGPIEHLECWFNIQAGLLPADDIRMTRATGGGNLLDMGCYCVNFLRMIAGDEVTVTSAEARTLGEVDGAICAQFQLPGGGSAILRTSMDQPEAMSSGAHIRGRDGSLSVENPFLPSLTSDPMWKSRITLETPGETTTEYAEEHSSYYHQAVAFERLVRSGDFLPSPARDGIANMAVLDAIREAAGLAE
jgi:predicted dehydrogenase